MGEVEKVAADVALEIVAELAGINVKATAAGDRGKAKQEGA